MQRGGASADFNRAMTNAADGGHVEIVKLCRGLWLGYEQVHEELLKYHHKHKFYRITWNELLPMAWHPDRWWDCCVSEDERLGKLGTRLAMS